MLDHYGLDSPQKTTIVKLDQKKSKVYQLAATKIAKSEFIGYTRADLDMKFWAF